ncbi:MAG: anthranilate phosphoribosyltransferase, partial [Candidatus Bathyanammoxibius sp.]
DRTKITELDGGDINGYYVQPEDYGIKRSGPEDLAAKDTGESALVITEILDGRKGPKRDVVLINAAAAILISGTVKDMEGGIRMAAGSIDSGRAKGSLKKLVELSRKDAA